MKRYPKLLPAMVLDALAFAYDNEPLVEEDLRKENDALEREQGPSPDGRQAKLPF
jgi:hypothetical protein